MSQYTTGEIAKLCGVTVRTVQYYDSRGILVPTELSEGGRRLYSEEDIRKLRIICFLRDLDLPISTIGDLLSEPEPGLVISEILHQRGESLRAEIEERTAQLEKVNELAREVRAVEHFSVESIGDIAYKMENRKKLRRLHGSMLVLGILLEAVEVSTFMIGLMKGIWWPFAIGLLVVILGSAAISVLYHRKTEYICPHCHTVFRPGFREMLFARHTPSTRKLTCANCDIRGFCVETYAREED